MFGLQPVNSTSCVTLCHLVLWVYLPSLTLSLLVHALLFLALVPACVHVPLRFYLLLPGP